ncbi:MAG TPA: nuclear transport factor 2 family protein [Myxococcaceae bacterium]|nr:nuclear transport factor 2 family protein [Myxococcaceae bacterium]
MRRTVLTLLVCAVPFVAQAADGGAKAGIDAANRKFEEAVAKGDAAAIAKLYAEDAEILPPDSPPKKGRDAIQKEFAGMIGAFKKITLKASEVHPMGNLAVEVGTWKLEDASGKGPDGKYMVLWKKHGSTWQLYRDMWSGNAPPPPPPAAAATPPASAPAPASGPAK